MLGQLILWLLALQVLSLAAFPFAYRVFSRLPDRGWAFSKPLGLLLVGLGTWAIGLTHTLPNSRWTVFLALLVVIGLSVAAARPLFPEIRAFIRKNAALIATVEGVFLAVFITVALLRASVPDIVHTEQPMDFMFLNAVIVSPHYPPNDAWMAGERASYYYLGYLLVGAVAMLSGTATAIAYNLGLATVAALGAVAAFGLAFNLIRLARGRLEGAVFGGFAAVFLLLVASHLGGVLELFRAAGGGSQAFWEAVGIEGLTAREPSTTWAPDDSPWWWWRMSRVIPDTINEFPAFSFLLGDLHPHVMSIGFVLLTAGVAVQVYLQPGILRRSAVREQWPLAATAVAVVGSLAPLNLWDLPLGLGLVTTALLLNAARNERTLQAGTSLAVFDRSAVLGAPGDMDGTGSVWTYRKRQRGWQRTGQATAAAPAPGAGLGTSVALDGRTMAAGAPGAGSAHVFTMAAGDWQERTVLDPSANGGLLGPPPRGFGRSVALEGETLAVGAPETPGGGAVYVFQGQADEWTLRDEIRQEGLPRGARFGAAIALHNDTLAVCAPGEEAVYVFDLDGPVWTRTARLTPGPETATQGFGRSVSLSMNLLAVGALGSAFVFRRVDGVWDKGRIVLPPRRQSILAFGVSVAVQDPYLVVGADSARNPSPRSGAAFVYKREDTAWRFQAELEAEDRGSDASFGRAVTLDGDTAAVGAPGSGHGAGYLFNRVLDKWNLDSKLVSRWRFGRAMLTSALLTLCALLLASPFLLGFESNADGVLPLRGLQSRPLHLLLIWGVFAVLVLPILFLAARRLFAPGNWSLMRFGVAAFVAFAPIVLWLQPIWGIPFYLTALLLNGAIIFLFGLHRAGYRLPKVDEMSFALNSGLTRVVGTTLLIALLLWDGVRHGERGVDGQYLAIDRLLIVTPMALLITLAIFAAWTLAHRDSERRRLGPGREDTRTRNDAYVPLLLLFAFAGALVMGVELFHVTDFFEGELRRMNTVFKAYYQAWLLLAVLGGFGLWALTRRLHIRTPTMRFTTTAWAGLLIMLLAAVSYYPLAAGSTRAGDTEAMRLDGQAFLAQVAPAEYEAIQWIRGNLPRDSIVLESAVVPCPENPAGCGSFTEAGRISASTGRPTILGWDQHQLQWRNDGTEIHARRADVRTIYETPDVGTARELLTRYNVEYVVAGPREEAAYGVAGLAKFVELGERVFHSAHAGGQVAIYRISVNASDGAGNG